MIPQRRPRLTPHVLAVVLCLLTAATPSSASNLFVNGDFEGCSTGPGFGSPGPGTVVTGCGWTFDANSAVNNAIGNPSKGVRLESTGLDTSDPTLSQSVAGLSIGTTYRLSWDLDLRSGGSGPTAANGPSFGIFLDDQTFADSLLLTSQLVDGYISSFLEFTATATLHTIIFAGELDGRTNGAGRTDVGYNIDNVCLDRPGGDCGGTTLTRVVEPAPLALVAVALLCAARRNRSSVARS